jgi:hypothetical protein
MTDIFDEVDDILSEVESTNLEAATPEVAEKNFNESELENIIAEIETLEKEFEADALLKSKLNSENEMANLQNEIDHEMEMTLITQSIDKEEESVSSKKSSKVLPFGKKSSLSYPSENGEAGVGEISFEAKGQMNLNLGFKIGEETAQLSIDPVKGLIVTLRGVELCINQEDGCKVTMDSGVNFTIPLTSSLSAMKKKSA